MLVSLSQSHGALPIDARGAASVKQVRHDGLPVVDDEGEGGVHASSGEVREGGWELQAEAGEVRANNGRAGVYGAAAAAGGGGGVHALGDRAQLSEALEHLQTLLNRCKEQEVEVEVGRDQHASDTRAREGLGGGASVLDSRGSSALDSSIDTQQLLLLHPRRQQQQQQPQACSTPPPSHSLSLSRCARKGARLAAAAA